MEQTHQSVQKKWQKDQWWRGSVQKSRK